MKLRDYRESVLKIGPTEAAKELGVDYIRYWRWENGKAMPQARALKKIKEWSGGEVTADDFLDDEG